MHKIQEESVRQYVRDLKSFYECMLTFGIVFVVCVIAWIATGGGFWPIWVFLAFSIVLIRKSLSLGMLSMTSLVENKWGFLRPEWEEQKVQKILAQAPKSSEDDSSPSSSRSYEQATRGPAAGKADRSHLSPSARELSPKSPPLKAPQRGQGKPPTGKTDL
ncbi:hypothetical protein AGMMS49949_02320 [Alphaproteobacteria bacterium]|nr:hypothetical protein AGMMS49949_02320 [Alphaproteobacteria bacterium]GHS96183.1 hypothetical protein AGMMS50296_2100 [Alphaproteobacteria bacterium]